MKNRIFTLSLWAVLGSVVLLFLILIISLFEELGTATPVRGVDHNEIFFAVKLTLITATISSILALAAAIPISYILSRHDFAFKNFIDSLLYLPIVLSPVALGAMLLLFFNTAAGRFLENHLFRVVFEVPAIVFAQFVVVIGLSVSLIKSVFEHIDPAYEEIARTLGASKFQVFTTVLLPLSKKGLVAAFLLTWAKAVGEFGATVTLAGATTMKTETLPVAIFLSFASADIYNAAIFILISLVISLGVLFVIKKFYAYPRKSML